MLRSFFLAIGISLAILGAECLVVDKAVLALSPSKNSEAPFSFGNMPLKNPFTHVPINRREVKPPEWAPWTLLAAGFVVSLYSVTVARRSPE